VSRCPILPPACLGDCHSSGVRLRLFGSISDFMSGEPPSRSHQNPSCLSSAVGSHPNAETGRPVLLRRLVEPNLTPSTLHPQLLPHPPTMWSACDAMRRHPGSRPWGPRGRLRNDRSTSRREKTGSHVHLAGNQGQRIQS